MTGAVGRARWTAALLVCTVVLTSCGKKKPKTEFEARAERLDSYLAALVPFGFSGGVLWSRGGEILLQKGYGQSDRGRGIAMTGETAFPLESVSKQFTAVAVLTLEAAGKLSVHDPITKYFANVPADKSGITLHHLLTHTSGILQGTEEYFDDNSRDAIIRVAMERPLLFPPGTSDAYSSIGYALLAAVVEDVSGMPFDAYITQTLFKPARMEHTGFRAMGGVEVAHRYLLGVDNGFPTDKNLDWNATGAAGLLSTTSDMLLWHQALMGTAILPDSSKEKMYTPVANDYGYGWHVSETDSGSIAEHTGGSSNGSAADYHRNLDKNEVIVVFANSDGEEMLFYTRLRDNVRAITRGELIADAPPVTPPGAVVDLAPFAGDYGTTDGALLHIDVVDQLLEISGTGPVAVSGLLSLSGEELARYNAVNEQSAAVLASAVAGDYQPAIASSSESLGPRLVSILKRVKDEKGLTGFHILGTVPPVGADGMDFMTIFSLHGNADSTVYRFYWDDSKITALGGSGIKQPVKIRARVAQGSKVVGYHIASGKSVELHYEKTASGPVTRLTGAVGGLDVSRADGR